MRESLREEKEKKRNQEDSADEQKQGLPDTGM